MLPVAPGTWGRGCCQGRVGEAGGPGQWASKSPGVQEKRGTGLGKEPQKGQKEANPAPPPSLFPNPDNPSKSPTGSAAWAGSTCMEVRWWSEAANTGFRLIAH